MRGEGAVNRGLRLVFHILPVGNHYFDLARRPIVLERFIDPIVGWAQEFGLLGLAIVSSTEAAFQPVPPDLMVIPMSIEADTNAGLMAIFLVATISSVFGSIGGYAIGIYGGRPLLDKFSSRKTSRKLEEITRRYGDAGIFIAALSPIPYKVLAWTAGAGRMEIKPFLFAGFLGRGIRFGLEVMIIGLWGDKFIEMLENPTFWAAAGILSIAIFIPIRSWWNGLDKSTEHSL